MRFQQFDHMEVPYIIEIEDFLEFEITFVCSGKTNYSDPNEAWPIDYYEFEIHSAFHSETPRVGYDINRLTPAQRSAIEQKAWKKYEKSLGE